MQISSINPEESFLSLFDEKELKKRISKELWEKFTTESATVFFSKNQRLFDEKEAPKAVFIIRHGIAKLCKIGTYSKEQILRFITEGDLVGYRSLLCGESFRAKAQALTEVEALMIPSEIFLQLLQEDPTLSFGMLKKIAFELGESCDTVTFLAQKTVRERLAEVLLALEQKLGTDPEGFIRISLTREEIANFIGTATESAIRLISEFKNDDLIEVFGRNIKIKDHEMLRKVSHLVEN